MTSRTFGKLLSTAILITTLTGSANSGIQEQPAPFLEDEMGQVWQPAPTPEGALAWQTLTDVGVREEEIDNFIQYVPTFTTALKALDGQKVMLNGYMIPLDTSDLQSHFILMAYPHSCPFHMPGGPGGYVEVFADFPVEFTYDPVLIEGHFTLLDDFSDGLFYRINAARAVDAP